MSRCPLRCYGILEAQKIPQSCYYLGKQIEYDVKWAGNPQRYKPCKYQCQWGDGSNGFNKSAFSSHGHEGYKSACEHKFIQMHIHLTKYLWPMRASRDNLMIRSCVQFFRSAAPSSHVLWLPQYLANVHSYADPWLSEHVNIENMDAVASYPASVPSQTCVLFASVYRQWVVTS